MRPGYWLVSRSAYVLALGLGGLRVTGREHLPPRAPYIVAANHISVLDPPVMGGALPVECAFFAKVELFANPLFGAFIRGLNAIPVRRGSADREALSRALAALRGGLPLVIFPEGTRDRSARLRPAKPGLGFLAVSAGTPIVPAYISGTNRFRCALARSPRMAVAFGPAIPPAGPLPDDPAARRNAYEEVGRAWREAVGRLEAATRAAPRAAS